MSNAEDLIGSVWVHAENGFEYEVMYISNKDSTKPKYQPTVTYRNTRTNELYSKPLAEWHNGRMSKVRDAKPKRKELDELQKQHFVLAVQDFCARYPDQAALVIAASQKGIMSRIEEWKQIAMRNESLLVMAMSKDRTAKKRIEEEMRERDGTNFYTWH